MAVTNAFEVETLTVQYTSAAQLLLQQTDTRLRGAVSSGLYTGSKAASPVQYMSAVQFKQAGGRGTPLTPQNTGWQRRWVLPADKDCTVQVDTFDLLRTIVDPKSPLSSAVQAAGMRLYDDVIINGAGTSGGFFGSATMGADPANFVTETFDSGSNFPVSVSIADTFKASGSVSLTIPKLLEAKRILRKYENDLEGGGLHLGLSSEEEFFLMQQIEYVSKEYRDTAQYDKTGRQMGFLGFQFHFSERLQIASSLRLLPAWLMDGMHLGLWKDMETTISQRNDLTGHPWQAYTMVTLGSTRLQGGKVVKISVAESSGAALTL